MLQTTDVEEEREERVAKPKRSELGFFFHNNAGKEAEAATYAGLRRESQKELELLCSLTPNSFVKRTNKPEMMMRLISFNKCNNLAFNI